jgi:hypothetical protein
MAFNNKQQAVRVYRTPHEANIRDGGKTVHVVIKYLSIDPAIERDGGGTWRNLENNALSSLH